MISNKFHYYIKIENKEGKELGYNHPIIYYDRKGGI